jgi:hypothetical protein
MTFVPATLPKQSRDETIAILEGYGINLNKPAVVADRGYYLTSLGKPGVNDRGIYDDAFFFYSPAAYATYNANTDPSAYRKGRGYGREKGMATLKPGVHIFRPGIHGIGLYNAGHPLQAPPKKPYRAFVQAEKFTVIRDGHPDYEDIGWFGINIHMGGSHGTSSEGCQTVYRPQWFSFYHLVMDQLNRFGVKTFPYVLIENK